MQFGEIDVFGQLRRVRDLFGLLFRARRISRFAIRPVFPARPVGAGPLPPVLAAVTATLSVAIVLPGTVGRPPVLIPSAFPPPITVAGRPATVLTGSAMVAFRAGAAIAAAVVILLATGMLVPAAAVLFRTPSPVVEPRFTFTVVPGVALAGAPVVAAEGASTAVVLPVVTTGPARPLAVVAARFSSILARSAPPVGRTAAPVIEFPVAAESAAVTAWTPSTVPAISLLPVVGFAPRLLTATLAELPLPVALCATIVVARLPTELVTTGAVISAPVLALAATCTILLRPAVTASGRPLLAGRTAATGIGSAAATAARVVGPGHQTSWELPNSLDNQRRPHPHRTGRRP